MLEIRALSYWAPALQPLLGGICVQGIQGTIIPVLSRQLKNISAKISVGMPCFLNLISSIFEHSNADVHFQSYINLNMKF